MTTTVSADQIIAAARERWPDATYITLEHDKSFWEVFQGMRIGKVHLHVWHEELEGPDVHRSAPTLPKLLAKIKGE